MTHTINQSLLSAVFTSRYIPMLFDGSDTHDPALRLSVALVRVTDDDTQIEQVISGALPADYAGDTLKELTGMIASARRKFSEAGAEESEASSAPAKLAKRIATELSKVVELFKDNSNKAYMALRRLSGGRLTVQIPSAAAASHIREYAWTHEETSLSANALEEVMSTLQSRAICGETVKFVHRRIGRQGDTIYIDLGDPDGTVVKIDPSGWTTELEPPIAFIRDDGFLALDAPKQGGDLDELRRLLNIDEDGWPLVLGFLLNCLRGQPPFMCLIVEGAQGSGKSFFCEVVKSLIDPNIATRTRLPRDERELMIQANSYYLLSFDNASGMSGDISDALCTLATGGGFVKRALYTDNELSVVSMARPFIINGIGDFVSRPDLMERAIPILLSVPDDRKTEDELRARLVDTLPGALGKLYDAVALALRESPNVAAPADIRMIDVAKWVTAAEPALGLNSGCFVEALSTAQAEIAMERVNNEPVTIQLFRAIQPGPYVGLLADLFNQCVELQDAKGLPRTPAHFSKELKRLSPQFKLAGLHVEFEEKTKLGRMIRVWQEGQDPTKAVVPLHMRRPM